MLSSLFTKPWCPALQLVTTRIKPDGTFYPFTELLDRVIGAVRGGVDMVQYRDDGESEAKRLEYALLMKETLSPYPHTKFIINDFVELAKEVNADGIWLGQDDECPIQARKILGRETFIGLSCDKPKDVIEANELPVGTIDAIAANGIFPSLLHPDAQQLGTEGLRRFKDLSKYPVVAIGGVLEDKIPKVIPHCDGIAVSGQILHAPDPEKTASKYIAAMELVNNIGRSI